MPQVPGMPGVPTAGSGGMPDTSTPGKITIPGPQTGTSAGDGDSVPSTAQSGGSPVPAGPGAAAGTGQEKTDDEILAEALQELNKRPGPPQQGEDAAGQAPQAGEGSPATTDAEKKQALGKELEQGFADFDRIMLSEQQALNEEANQEGYGGFPEDDDFTAAHDPAQGNPAEPLQTAMVNPDSASIKGDMEIPTRSHSQVPPDLADASDDDIIARQLREAAMKEQDPELREKLWDEYRKYKRDSR